MNDPPGERTHAADNRVGDALAWLIPFALVVYLSLRGGGYESVVRDQAATVLWLVILAAFALGFLPAVRQGRRAWIPLAILLAILGWAALSALWSDSVERTFDTVTLIGAYLAIFVLAMFGPARLTLMRTASAVAAAIGVVAALALISRLAPGWFPEDQTIAALPDVSARLKYPLGSWNGLAGFVALGVPLLLAFAVGARTMVARIAATVALPVCALVIDYTISRGGIVAAALGVVVFLALHPRRISSLPTLLITGIASAAAVLAANGFEDLNTLSAGFEAQAETMAVVLAGICAATALAMAALVAAERRGRIPEVRVEPRLARRIAAVGAVLIAIAAVVVVGSGKASEAWERFKSPADPGITGERVVSASGNLRYQQWDTAVEAAGEAPVGGRGAGTYEYWWAREGDYPSYTRYAHSLYLEALAETGIVGFILFVAFVVSLLVLLIRRAIKSTSDRIWVAAVAASGFVFAFTMGIDWAWYIPAIPVAFLLVAAAALRQDGDKGEPSPRLQPVWRVAAVIATAAMLLLTATSWLGAQKLLDSQQAVRSDDLDAAFSDAEAAEWLKPYAASPHLQQALVLEQTENLGAAAFKAGIASAKDPFNWEPRWVLSRIEDLGGNEDQARADFEAARQLNPLAPFFTLDRDQSALTPTE